MFIPYMLMSLIGEGVIEDICLFQFKMDFYFNHEHQKRYFQEYFLFHKYFYFME